MGHSPRSAVRREAGPGRASRDPEMAERSRSPDHAGWADFPGFAGDDPRAVLRTKVERFHQALAQWQREGRDLREVGKIMQQFEPYLHAGKVHEAEAVLDRALAVLNAR